MSPTAKKIMAYAPAAIFLTLDVWAFSTGTYASERDKLLPYYFAGLSILYMLPAIIAAHRNHSHFVAIWIVDLLGTFIFLIGWFIALVWAFLDPRGANADRIPG